MSSSKGGQWETIYGAISVGRNLCWRGAAGQGVPVSAVWERDQVASGVAQSSGPRVRVIAPEKEVMIGGVRWSSEGFRGRSLEEFKLRGFKGQNLTFLCNFFIG